MSSIAPSTLPPGARSIANFNRQSPVVKKGLAHDAGQVRHLVQPPGAQPGRRAGSRLHRRQRGAEPRRHRDGAGPVHQGRAGGRRGVPDRHRPCPGHRHQTGKVPNTSATAASSGSDLNGMAALDAAEQIKARMTEVAAEHFDVPADEIVFFIEPHLCRQPQPVVRRARGAVLGEARVAVGDRLLPHAQRSIGTSPPIPGGRSSISPMARPPPKSRSIL